MPILRFLRVVLGASLRSRLRPLDESRIRMVTWPNDLDVNLHMNNGRFLTLMDLGRYDLMGRLGFLKHARRRRWMPVVAAATIRFRRSLAPFARYTLRTRILGWDEKWVFLEQRFERGSDLVAVGIVKTLVRSKAGNVPTRDLLAVIGHEGPSPALPAAVRARSDLDVTASGT